MVSGSRISPTINTSGSSRKLSSKRLFKTGRVPPHFPLADERLARTEGEFNRAFNRDDVPGVAQVDRLDQRGQGGGFAAAGRAADQHQAVGVIDQLLEVGMEVQRFQSSAGTPGANGWQNPPRARFAGC